MRRALPTIAISAAGVTWLLHAQGVIDTGVAPAGSTPTAPTAGAASQAAAPATTTPTTTVRPSGRRTPGAAPDPGQAAPPTTAPTTPSTSGGASGSGSTFNGSTVRTEFGPLQVAAVVSDGKLTDVKVLQYPDDHRKSQQINNRALPQLRQEALAAQSAQLDSISGATITSDAYTTSLQSALDAAGLR